ncbi:MAG: hypothetical protein ABEN55_09805 [Bradymonadaceae bacterium]
MWTLAERNELSQAESVAREVIEEAKQLRALNIESSGWNIRGDIAKFRGDYTQARGFYQKAVELAYRTASRKSIVIELNRTMVEVADRDFQAAHDTLERLDDRLHAAGMPMYSPFVSIGRAATAVSRGEWEQWRDEIAEFESVLDEHGVIQRDLAWFAEVTAEITAECGDASQGEEMFEIARTLWRELGDESAVARLDERLAAI